MPVHGRSSFERIYAGQPRWEIGRPRETTSGRGLHRPKAPEPLERQTKLQGGVHTFMGRRM